MSRNTGAELYKRAKELIPGGTQVLSKRPEMFLPDQWPAYYSRAQGPYVWDLDGNRYVDMSYNGIGACPLGYADMDVNCAVVSAIEKGSMCTLNCPEEVELAELLCSLHPWASMVRYARTGGESMSIAVRIARAFTGRSRVVFCGYHGWSDWYLAANLGPEDVLGSEGLLLPGLEPAGVPEGLTGTALAFRFNRADELRKAVSSRPGEIAAIICEPQRGERPLPGFLEDVRSISDEAGAVLVFDEITSAMRLTTGGVHALYGVEPDIAVFAKGISNGIPMAAVLGRQAVMQAAQSTFISSTYWTDRTGPTAALATIRKYQGFGVVDRLSEIGTKVQQGWRMAIEQSGLQACAGHPDMAPLSHLSFFGPNARAVKTLLCQMMLERGFLDNGAFYATFAHTDEVLESYLNAVNEIFPALARAEREGRIRDLLKGPVGHSGFARLIS